MACKNCEKAQQLVDLLRELIAEDNHPVPHTVVDIAVDEIGVEEEPRGSNDGVRVREYLRASNTTIPAPWCAAFVLWCYERVGVDMFTTAHVATMWDKNRKIQHKTPKVGDTFIMIFSNGSGHCGIVEKVFDDGTIGTIEGNTDPQGSRNGYGVFRRTRKISECRGFLRFGLRG